MKFDSVVGNPPYNSGMDLDFIDLGYNISNKNVCVVVPAKWQTTADDYNGCASEKIDYASFRVKYTQHMKYVCFYPMAKDIFDILQPDGITYFLLTKDTHNETIVENKSTYFSELNSIALRSIQNRESLINIGNEVVQSLGEYKSFTFPVITGNKRYQVWMNNKIPGGGFAGVCSNRQILFTGDCHIEDKEDILYDKLERSTACEIAFESSEIAECKSFISYMNTKLVQFCIAINISKLSGVITNDCFRLVPQPIFEYNHIYTDDDLYKAYNLSQEHITFIEKLIKKR